VILAPKGLATNAAYSSAAYEISEKSVGTRIFLIDNFITKVIFVIQRYIILTVLWLLSIDFKHKNL
jgi:hypothetical protein